MTRHVGGTMAVFVLEAIFYLTTSILGRAAMIQATAEVHVGTRPQWLSNIRAAVGRFCALFLTYRMFASVMVIAYLVVALVLMFSMGVILGPDSALMLLFGVLIFVSFPGMVLLYVMVVGMVVFPVLVVT